MSLYVRVGTSAKAAANSTGNYQVGGKLGEKVFILKTGCLCNLHAAVLHTKWLVSFFTSLFNKEVVQV